MLDSIVQLARTNREMMLSNAQQAIIAQSDQLKRLSALVVVTRIWTIKTRVLRVLLATTVLEAPSYQSSVQLALSACQTQRCTSSVRLASICLTLAHLKIVFLAQQESIVRLQA